MKEPKYTSLGQMFHHSVAQYSNEPAWGYVGQHFQTYKEVGEDVKNIMAELQVAGVQKGDRVALLSANMPNWGKVYFAVLSMGAIIVPILPDFSETEIENVLNHSEAKVLFVSTGLYKKFSKIETVSTVRLYHVDSLASIPAQCDYADLADLKFTPPEHNINPDQFEIDEDDVASIIYTSGTTGKSKGVMLMHRNLISNTIGGSKIQPIDNKDRFLSLLPLSHTYENTLGLILPTMFGASVSYLDRPPVPSTLLKAMKEVKPTMMLSVPLIIEKIYKSKVVSEISKKWFTRLLYKVRPFQKLINEKAGTALYDAFGGNLKFFGIGGAKLNKETERFLHDSKFPYAIGYGLTETAPLLAGKKVSNRSFQTTGLAVEGVELKINNPDKKTGEGEVWARGLNVMKGYFKEAKLTSEVITKDGWFKTGDLGVFDKQMNLSLKGRLKNMIVGSSGENIYPEEIEAVINRFKHVAESIVVQKKGRLVALVRFNTEELEQKYKSLKEQAGHAPKHIDQFMDDMAVELRSFVNAHVNKFSQVQVVMVQAQPFERTATHKIKRFLYS